MEIHAPDHPITSWKDTAKHLAIITAGVLIALALEGVVAWADHRLLVREAKANLTAELRSNREDLKRLFPGLEKGAEELDHADDLAVLLLAHHRPPQMEISLHAVEPELKNAAVTTGQITGAFGYMEYGEVRKYADVYDLQAQFMRLQERENQHFADVLSFVRRVAAPEPPPADAIERWRSQIDVALSGIYIRQQVGRQLMARYDELLK